MSDDILKRGAKAMGIDKGTTVIQKVLPRSMNPKKTIKHLWHLLFEHEIIRRYVIINTFDGALTILGIIAASWFAGITDPQFLILPSLGAGIAMCVSGVWGAYAAESAELKREIKALEKHLVRSLTNTHIQRENQKIAMIVGAVDGLAPLLATLLIIIPFFFARAQVLSIGVAYGLSLTLTMIVLLLLGAFAGYVARESRIKHALRMLVAGGVLAIIFFVMEKTGLL